MKLVSQIAYIRLHNLLPDVTLYLGNTAPTSAEEAEDAFVVLKEGREFRRNNLYNSVEDQQLWVNVYVGRSKELTDWEYGLDGPGSPNWDADGVKPQQPEEITQSLFERIDPLLNGMTQTDWPDVVTCTRRSSELLAVPDGGGAVLLSSVYDIRTW